MKNFKQIAFGLLVGALALGFSAFTSAPKSHVKVTKLANGKFSVTADYYRKAAFASAVTDTDPTHYIYRDASTSADCNSNDFICKASWDTSNMPTNGQTPAQAGSPTNENDLGDLGIYNGL